MNPITSMLSEAKIFASVAPALLKIGASTAKNFTDIQAQSKSLVSGLEKAFEDAKHLDVTSAEVDLGVAWKAGMKVYADTGISRDVVSSVVATASTAIPSLSGLQAAIYAGEALIGKLGVKV